MISAAVPVVFRLPVTARANDARAVICARPDGPGPYFSAITFSGAWIEAVLAARRRVRVSVDGDATGIRSLDELNRAWHDLSHHGLRDWLIVHRLLHERAPSTIEWTPDAHVGGTLYERLARREGRPRIVAGIERRLQLVASLELAWPDRGRWRPVTGLVTLGAPGHGGRIPLKVAPSLGGANRSRYALIPEGLLLMDAGHVRLGVELLAGLHHDRSSAGRSPTSAGSHRTSPLGRGLRLREETLWAWGAIRVGLAGRRRWPAAQASVAGQLTRLQEGQIIGGFEYDGTLGPEAKYTVYPASWWRAVVDDGERPETVALAGIPDRGSALREWRRRRGWSQTEVGRLVGVSQSRVSAAEQDDEHLPRSWRRGLKDGLRQG